MKEFAALLDYRKMPPGPQRLGAFIAFCRMQRGWKQTELAKRAGVNAPYLSTVEAGQRNWPATIIAKIAPVLEVPESRFAEEAGIVETASVEVHDVGTATGTETATVQVSDPMPDAMRRWVAAMTKGERRIMWNVLQPYILADNQHPPPPLDYHTDEEVPHESPGK